MASLPVPLPSPRRDPAVVEVAIDRLADCVRRLDPGTRALLDLSVRRRLRDDAMAPLLHTDAFHLAWRRARALEKVASEMGDEEPLPLASVRAALEVLPREAWDPLSMPPALPPGEKADGGGQKAEHEAEDPAAAVTTEPPPDAPADADAEAVAPATEPATGTELVPAATAEVDTPQSPGVIARLDAFATTAPTLRQAFGGVGRAFGRKAVRLVVWRRRRA
jgi:hypothetical protein